jgi:ribulose-bisphosphate carboxylase small chain
MRVTQGAFSYLPDLSDDQIRKQIAYILENGWAISLERTDDPHPRNAYWDMIGLPMFDETDPGTVLELVRAARADHPNEYIKLNAYDARLGRQTTALSFIVNRPAHEPGFRLERRAENDRTMRYQLHAYATDRPSGERYARGSNGAS